MHWRMVNNPDNRKEWRESTVYVGITIANICWGFSYVWTNIALRSFPVITLLESRLLLSFILIFLFGRFVKQIQQPRREDIKWFLLLAFFEPFLYFIGETFGLTRVSPTIASVLISTIPLFAPFAAYFVLKEKFVPANIAGICISLCGVYLIVSIAGKSHSADATGIALIGLAIFSALIYSLILKKLTAHYSSLTLIGFQNAIGFVYFLPLFFGSDFSKLHAIVWRTDSIVCMLLLALFASFIAFVFFAESIRRIGIARSNAFTNLLPALTAIFSVIVLGEVLTTQQIIGILIVIGGLFVSQLTKKAMR